MKLTKAIISVLLVAGMLTMLCACGSKKEEPAPAGSASAEVTPAADAGIGLDILTPTLFWQSIHRLHG